MIAINVALLFWLLSQGCQYQPVIKQGYTLHFVYECVHVQEWYLICLFVYLLGFW